MIINLLALLAILASGAVAGVLFTVRYAAHRHTKLRANEQRLAEIREVLASQPTLRDDLPSPHDPGVLHSRDRLPI